MSDYEDYWTGQCERGLALCNIARAFTPPPATSWAERLLREMASLEAMAVVNAALDENYRRLARDFGVTA
jgi:hypothetical protein